MNLRTSFAALGILAVSGVIAGCNNNGVCDAGERCGWRDSNFGGSLADWEGNDSNFSNEPNGDDAMYTSGGVVDTANASDRISSVRNLESGTIWWFADSSCAGDDTPLGPNGQLNTMPGGGGDVGDNEASAVWNGTSC